MKGGQRVLSLPIYGPESYDSSRDRFTRTELFRLELEHSLVSLSKWESKFEKPFLGDGEKSGEEVLWYIEAMHQGENLPEDFHEKLEVSDIEAINDYINAKMTATWFADVPGRTAQKEIITAEIIYYWMVSLNIPFECQNWHLNRLLTLIRVINEKNSPPKKLSREEVLARNRAINEQRQKQYGTAG
jgi:hypothetical protein